MPPASHGRVVRILALALGTLAPTVVAQFLLVPPSPPPPWDYAFGVPNLQPCNKQFDYVLVMQWSVGGPHTGGRDGLAGSNTEADIKAVAGAWVRKFAHGSAWRQEAF